MARASVCDVSGATLQSCTVSPAIWNIHDQLESLIMLFLNWAILSNCVLLVESTSNFERCEHCPTWPFVSLLKYKQITTNLLCRYVKEWLTSKKSMMINLLAWDQNWVWFLKDWNCNCNIVKSCIKATAYVQFSTLWYGFYSSSAYIRGQLICNVFSLQNLWNQSGTMWHVQWKQNLTLFMSKSVSKRKQTLWNTKSGKV